MRNVFLAALMLIGITTFAQDKETPAPPRREKLTPEQRVELQVKRMTKDLDLNEKQVADMRTLVTKQMAQIDAKRAEMKEKREMNVQKRAEAKANMEKERAANEAEMKKILTPEQYAKWDRLREERRAKMKEKFMENKEENVIEKGLEPAKK